MSTPEFRRILRRETHSPRTVAMIVAVIVVILALVYVGIEIVLSLLAQPALLLGPAAAAGWIIGLPTAQPSALVIGGGVLIGLVGLVFLILGVTPGRLPKHQMSINGRAAVVDNGVIASSLAQRISEETGIRREDITVGVSHRTADVTIRSGFGDPYDAAPITQVVDAELERYTLIPPVTSHVRVLTPSEREQDR